MNTLFLIYIVIGLILYFGLVIAELLGKLPTPPKHIYAAARIGEFIIIVFFWPLCLAIRFIIQQTR